MYGACTLALLEVVSFALGIDAIQGPGFAAVLDAAAPVVVLVGVDAAEHVGSNHSRPEILVGIVVHVSSAFPSSVDGSGTHGEIASFVGILGIQDTVV
jgi:hypothetical protein